MDQDDLPGMPAVPEPLDERQRDGAAVLAAGHPDGYRRLTGQQDFDISCCVDLRHGFPPR